MELMRQVPLYITAKDKVGHQTFYLVHVHVCALAKQRRLELAWRQSAGLRIQQDTQVNCTLALFQALK